MSDSDFLSRAFSIISSRSSDIEDKIERLKKAKRDIQLEQDQSLVEIKQMKKPYLDRSWEGKDANLFDDYRHDAYEKMRKKINNYDNYIDRIESEIMQLRMQQDMLDIASTVAYQADRLLGQGEEVLDDLNRKVNELKRWLF